MNQVNLVGNLGGEVELRTTAGGTVVGRMQIATKEKRKDRDGNWADHTEWHRVVLFGRTAENAAKFTAKGSQVAVTGRLQNNKWEDKDKIIRYTTEIIADTIQFLDSKATTDSRRSRSGTGPGYSGNPRETDTQGRPNNSGDAFGEANFGDDIPF